MWATIISILLVLGPPVAVSYFAHEKGKNFKLWFIIGLFFNVIAFYFLKEPIDNSSDRFQ
ncbi:hypothetical protein N9A28_02865 [Sulfurimonas sp.]|nr:hypothetical protein [Sulfurimonas sp.]